MVRDRRGSHEGQERKGSLEMGEWGRGGGDQGDRRRGRGEGKRVKRVERKMQRSSRGVEEEQWE